MTKADREGLGRYVRACADLMELRDWTFRVEIGDTKTPENAPPGLVWGASCDPVPGRKAATITFQPWQRDEPRESLRQTVAHELTHCHWWPCWDTVRSDLVGPLSQQAYDLFTDGFHRQMEFCVDALGDAIAPRLPLIEWPTKGRA